MKFPSPISLERRRSEGFSLLEVVVAVAILSIAIAAIIQLYSMDLKSIRKSELYTEAVLIARSAMDEALSMEDPEKIGNPESPDERFDLTRTVTALAEDNDDSPVKTYEITVHVSFRGGSVELKARKSVPKDQT